MLFLLRGASRLLHAKDYLFSCGCIRTTEQIYDGLLKHDESALKKSCDAEVVKRVRLIEAEYGTLKKYSLTTFVKDPVAPYIEVKVIAYREKEDSHLKVRLNEVATFSNGQLGAISFGDAYYGK